MLLSCLYRQVKAVTNSMLFFCIAKKQLQQGGFVFKLRCCYTQSLSALANAPYGQTRPGSVEEY